MGSSDKDRFPSTSLSPRVSFSDIPPEGASAGTRPKLVRSASGSGLGTAPSISSDPRASPTESMLSAAEAALLVAKRAKQYPQKTKRSRMWSTGTDMSTGSDTSSFAGKTQAYELADLGVVPSLTTANVYRMENWRKRFRRSSIGAFLTTKPVSPPIETHIGDGLQSRGNSFWGKQLPIGFAQNDTSQSPTQELPRLVSSSPPLGISSAQTGQLSSTSLDEKETLHSGAAAGGGNEQEEP